MRKITMLGGSALLVLACCGAARADDATWIGHDGNWLTGANWSTEIVPLGTAVFDATGITKSVFSTFDVSAGALQIDAAGYAFDINSRVTLNGAGITGLQNATITVTANQWDPWVSLTFAGGATAARATIHNAVCGETDFTGQSTAANATFLDDDCSGVEFRDSSTGAHATFTGGNVGFHDNATADHVVIVTSGGTGEVVGFSGHANAASADISVSGQYSQVAFLENASGGLAHVAAGTGSEVNFLSALGPNGDHQIVIGSIDGAGDVLLGANQLTIGGDNRSMAITGAVVDNPFDPGIDVGFPIVGGGLIKTGTGTLTLAGANAYTGATVVNGGTLAVTGTIAPSSGVTVHAGGTLAGTGTVSTTTVGLGGILAPGLNGVGTLHANTSVTFQGGAIFAVDANALAADRLTVTGSAALGGTLVATVSGTPAVGMKYTVLSASGGVTGTFALSAATLGAVVPRLSYDGNDVYLEFVAGTLTPGQNIGNPAAVIGGIDHAILAGDTLPPEFQGLGTLSPAALDTRAAALSGEAAAALPRLGQSSVNTFLTLLMNQPGDMDDDLMARAGAPLRFASLGYQGIGASPIQARLDSGDAALWLTGFGGHTSTTGVAAAGTHDIDTGATGVAGGVDVLIDRDLVAGFAVADGHTSFALDTALGGGAADVLQFGGYATQRMGAGYVSLAGTYGLQDTHTLRIITAPGAATLAAKVQAQTYAGRVEAGYRFVLPGFGLTPYLAVQADGFHTPAYAETAVSGSSVFALSFAPDNRTSTRIEAGTGIDDTVAISRNGTLHLYGRLAYVYDAGSDPTAHAAFQALPGSDFTVHGADPGGSTGLLSLGAELRGRNGLAFGIKFDGALSEHATAYFGALDLRFSW